MAFRFVMIIGAFLSAGAQLDAEAPVTTSRPPAPPSPIRKVTTLIQEMKAQVEKEGDEDKEVFDKYVCWCDTTKEEKEAAIANAEKTLDELAAFLESAAAKEGQLKTEIGALQEGIADDQESLATATAVREKEHEAFAGEEADMKESAGLLAQAVDVLGKVQLTQKPQVVQAAVAALIQVRKVVQRSPRFGDVMRHDLYDVLSSLQETSQDQLLMTDSSFLGPKRRSAQAVLAQAPQDGHEPKPNDLEGAAAGAKSYNAQSGSILGMLGEMHAEFLRDLAAAQKEELQALIEFEKLRAAKTAEIKAATEQKESKEAELADLVNKVAKSKEDQEALQEAMAADQKFLVEMEKGCTAEKEHYASRVKVRTEEIRALGETITILTDDASRDLFGKTISLVQLSATTRAAAQNHAQEGAMKRLAEVAKRHNNWALVSLAVRVRLDAFTKVKAAMDAMLTQLQEQQKEEYEKHEFCNKEIDQTEDSIKEGQNEKEDLDEKHESLVNTLTTLEDDIAKLKAEVKDTEVSLKVAGEDRHAENQLFKSSVSDQRATVEILNKALARLKQFYAAKDGPETPAFAQQEPGAAVAPPPPKPKEYSKSDSAGGVVQLLMKIIEEAQVAEQELEMSEQKSQEDYAALVRDTTESIEASRKAIEEKTEQRAEALAAKSETQAAQAANDQELTKLGELLQAHHLDCDYITKYFDVRQTARAEEMDAISDAKAILSGADFGK